MKKMMAAALLATAAFAMSGCQSAPMAPAAPPAAALAPPPTPGVAGAAKMGAGSKPGFCTFKDPSGKLYEAKC